MPQRTPAMNAISTRLIVLLLALFGLPASVLAQSYTISPPPYLLAQNNSGAIINNACVWTYNAGTTTAATTYSDNAGTANANPIRSDSAGRFTAFLAVGQSYKFVYESACTPPAHGTTLRTADNVSAMPASGGNVDVTATAGEAITAGQCVYWSDGSGGKNSGQIYKCDTTNAYSSTTNTVGIAPNAIASGSSGTVRISGLATGLSSLSAGSSYYVGVSGAVTSTATSRKIGQADTATSLVLSAPTVTVPLNIVEGRLTATTVTPVTTADVSAATSIYWTPYKGSRISLFDGANWNIRTFSEIAISISSCTASKPYDVFLYDSSGTVTAETLVWTNTTTRATALVFQDGVLSKTGALTRRYVGSFFCNGTGGQTDDTGVKRYVWNYYNRVQRPMVRMETTASWTYTTATVRQANGSTANQFDVMVGWAEVNFSVSINASAGNGTGGVAVSVGIGQDSTTAYLSTIPSMATTAGASRGALTCHANLNPPIGRHVYSWNEWSTATGTTTWYGDDSGSTAARMGMAGWIEG